MDHSIDHASVPLAGDPGSAPSRTFTTDTARMIGGVERCTIGGVTQTRVSDNGRTSTADLFPRDGSQGILQTARSISGRPLSGSDIKANTTVIVAGVETSVAAAVAAGFLQRNGD